MKVKPVYFLGALVLVALGWKFWLLVLNVFPFNADEAVVALMARHILAGERPIFFYGQAYMGSLDAFLVAIGFSLFGQAVWVIRLVQTVLYTATIITTVFIGKVAFDSIKIGLVAGLSLAIPSVNSTLYTTISLGGYGEALLLGSLNLWFGFMILAFINRPGRLNLRIIALIFGWGLSAGIGLWANALSFVFCVPMGAALLLKSLKKPAILAGYWKLSWIAILGFGIGSVPWWVFAFQRGFQNLITELLGSAVAVDSGSWLTRIWGHVLNLALLGLPAGLGMRPPWSVNWLALPLIPLILAFWGLVAVYFVRSIRQKLPERRSLLILAGMIIVFCLAFVLTSFGVDPSGRYFIVLAVPLALIGSSFIFSLKNKEIWKYGLVGLILVFNIWGTVDCALKNPPGLTTQFDTSTVIDQARMPELIAFLKQNGESRGYSNYWVSYPLAFLSGEDLIFVPRLPYHADLRYSSRDDRYPPYDLAIQANSQAGYITTRNPALDSKLREGFSRLGVTWLEKQIGDFQIYYHLSKPAPLELLNDGNWMQ